MSTAQVCESDISIASTEAVLAPNLCHRVEELWFDDGTLVLHAGTSTFRVYRALLAKISPVFHDMLAFPQPVDGEKIDGCPVVRLPDNDSDLKCFLQALFDYT